MNNFNLFIFKIIQNWLVKIHLYDEFHCSTLSLTQNIHEYANNTKQLNEDSIFMCIKYTWVQIFHSRVRRLRVHVRINSSFQLRSLVKTKARYHPIFLRFIRDKIPSIKIIEGLRFEEMLFLHTCIFFYFNHENKPDNYKDS